MKKYFYTGDIAYLIKNNYRFVNSYLSNFYIKIVSYNNYDKDDKNSYLICRINIKTKEVNYKGNMSLKKYFDKELEGKIVEKEVN